MFLANETFRVPVATGSSERVAQPFSSVSTGSGTAASAPAIDGQNVKLIPPNKLPYKSFENKLPNTGD